MRKNSWLYLAVMLIGISSSGCAHVGGQGTGKDDGETARYKIEKYFPLAVGNSWTFQTSFQDQSQPDLTVKIIKKDKGFFVDDRPRPSRLHIDASGIRDGNIRYLLKAPLKKGSKWMSVADIRTVEHFEIAEVARKIKTPAGVFNDCVVVNMEVKIKENRSMVNRMTFAPDIGIVEIRALLYEGTKAITQSYMVLKTYKLAPEK
ncbi:MAG: hypothetical protein JRJ19_00140 [Deltaproteobacteria bacterium]|nr:hypothetical protein [Deltaproteobacteria bacterium]MBW1870439.1 hypothetical protein [Deltaproteobacteria bacterium]